jgi:hemerythrin
MAIASSGRKAGENPRSSRKAWLAANRKHSRSRGSRPRMGQISSDTRSKSMTMVQWSDEYSVNIQEIDEQHKIWIGLINELYMAMAKKDASDKIGAILERLVDYTKIHFALEECLMRIFGYPGYEAHKQIHDAMVRQVDELVRKYRLSDGQVGMETLFLLKDWLINHIKEKDTGYAPYLLKQGVLKRWARKFW